MAVRGRPTAALAVPVSALLAAVALAGSDTAAAQPPPATSAAAAVSKEVQQACAAAGDDSDAATGELCNPAASGVHLLQRRRGAGGAEEVAEEGLEEQLRALAARASFGIAANGTANGTANSTISALARALDSVLQDKGGRWGFGFFRRCSARTPYRSAIQTVPIANRYFNDVSFISWFTLPRQTALEKLRDRLRSVPMRLNPAIGTFGAGNAWDLPFMMYEATNVKGVAEKVPEALRGCFWMRGNCVAEEIICLQHGRWFPEENIYVATVAPFSWAWPLGRPADAPCGGSQYSADDRRGMENARAITEFTSSLSFKFEPCPSSAAYCNDPSDPLGWAYMQIHPFGYLRTQFQIAQLIPSFLPAFALLPPGTVTGTYSLQAMPNSVKGSHWARTSEWGVNRCPNLEFGTYDLMKIIDHNGRPVQPAFDDFKRYMGNVELLVWSGWESEEQRQATIDRAFRGLPPV